MAAAETNNFTLAAEKACMTQPGVSQHISKLEQQIGLPLFKRIGRQVTLTDTGQQLVNYIKSYLMLMDEFRESVHSADASLSGLVTYAMPASCLLSPHFPLLLKKRLQYDEIELDVRLEPTEKVIQTILADKADFGFVTEKVAHPDLAYTPFCYEEYILVGAEEKLNGARTEEEVKRLSYIQYPGFNTYCNLWMHHAFGSKENLSETTLRFVGHGSTIETAILMVRGKLGVSIFPRHCVAEHLDSGELKEIEIEDKALNEISIVTTKNHKYPRRVHMVIDWFLEMRS